MRKKILIMGMASAITMSCLPNVVVQASEQINTAGVETVFQTSLIVKEPQKTREVLAQEEMDSIAYLMEEDKEEYLHKYYEILTKYDFDMPESVYDVFSTDEIDLFARLVEAEMTGENIDCKCNAASVILNRYNSEEFPDTLSKIIYQKKPSVQFSPTVDGRLYKVEVTVSSIKAIEYAFLFGDTTSNSTFFCNKEDVKDLKTLAWFNDKLEYVMTDESGTSYYKLKEQE